MTTFWIFRKPSDNRNVVDNCLSELAKDIVAAILVLSGIALAVGSAYRAEPIGFFAGLALVTWPLSWRYPFQHRVAERIARNHDAACAPPTGGKSQIGETP